MQLFLAPLKTHNLITKSGCEFFLFIFEWYAFVFWQNHILPWISWNLDTEINLTIITLSYVK